MEFNILSVIENDFCIGCGVCSYFDSNFSMFENDEGLYDVHISKKITYNIEKLNKVCPFSSKLNEDDLSELLFDCSNKHTSVGKYHELLAGHVKSEHGRLKSSSGGVITWLLSELLKREYVDGVIHVKRNINNINDTLYEYDMSYTVDELYSNSGTKYYPVNLGNILKKIQMSDKKYALVGVPCFIKAVRLLQFENPLFREKIPYIVGLFCGGMKTKLYTNFIAHQMLVNPNSVLDVNYREKDLKNSADKYRINIKTQNKSFLSPYVRNLYGMDWGEGFFKPKACDWCDDISSELADISFGDAWIKPFVNDPKGHNIIVVRKISLLNLILKSDELLTVKLSIDDLVKSQAANIRHRQIGIIDRVSDADELNKPHPIKRRISLKKNNDIKQKNISNMRSEISRASFSNYQKFINKPYFLFYFARAIFPIQYKYYELYGKRMKFVIRQLLILYLLIIRKILNK